MLLEKTSTKLTDGNKQVKADFANTQTSYKTPVIPGLASSKEATLKAEVLALFSINNAPPESKPAPPNTTLSPNVDPSIPKKDN